MERLRETTVTRIKGATSKPVLGDPLGDFQLIFRYADKSCIPFEGKLTDVTLLFLNRSVQAEAKDIVLEEIDFFTSNNEQVPAPVLEDAKTDIEQKENAEKPQLETAIEPIDKSSALNTAKKVFEKYDFLKACRVLLFEESFSHRKHIILQVKRLDSLIEYAYHLDSTQWGFVRGLKFEYVASGSAATFAHKKDVLDIGEVFIHIFVPDDYREISKNNSDALDNAKSLAELVPYFPQIVNIKELIKAKDVLIESGQESLRLMRIKMGQLAAKLDAAGIAVAGHGTKVPAETLTPKRLDFWDAVIAGVPTFLFGAIGSALGSWVGGAFIGWLIGFGLVFRRK